AFAPAFLLSDSLQRGRAMSALAPASPWFGVGPTRLPLRRPAKLEVTLRRGEPGHAALYFERAGGWSPAGPAADELPSATPSSTGLTGEVRGLGRFGVFVDTLAPRIGPVRAVRIRTGAPNR